MKFAAVLAVAVSFLWATNSVGRPPNIVVFLVDDLGATDIGCFGSTFYETPNVDRLARDGMRFTASYSACPVCSPTRASMMTGRYPQRAGITDYINPRANQPEQWNRNTRLLPAPYQDHLALDERTIAEVLHDAGYKTFFAGKWHLGGKGFLPTDQGRDQQGWLRSRLAAKLLQPVQQSAACRWPRGRTAPAPPGRGNLQVHYDQSRAAVLAYLSFYCVHIPLQCLKS